MALIFLTSGKAHNQLRTLKNITLHVDRDVGIIREGLGNQAHSLPSLWLRARPSEPKALFVLQKVIVSFCLSD